MSFVTGRKRSFTLADGAAAGDGAAGSDGGAIVGGGVMSVKTGCGVLAVDPGVDWVAVVGGGLPLDGAWRCRATHPPIAMPITARMIDAAIAPPLRFGEASGGGGLVE